MSDLVANISRRRTWSDAEGQRESAVPLEILPAGVCFAEDFPEPIRFDAARKQLLYRGFMSYSSFCYLQQLHSDASYAKALDRLFQASTRTPEERSLKRTSGWWLTVLAAAALGIVAIAVMLIR